MRARRFKAVVAQGFPWRSIEILFLHRRRRRPLTANRPGPLSMLGIGTSTLNHLWGGGGIPRFGTTGPSARLVSTGVDRVMAVGNVNPRVSVRPS